MSILRNLLLGLMTSLFVVGSAYSQTRVVVLTFKDSTRKIDPKSITDKMRNAINRTPGYWTYPPDTFQSNITRYGLKMEQMYNVSNQKQVADLMKIDYYVEGNVTPSAQKFLVQVSLRDAKQGSLLISRQYAFAGEFTDQLAAIAVNDLLGKGKVAPVAVDSGRKGGQAKSPPIAKPEKPPQTASAPQKVEKSSPKTKEFGPSEPSTETSWLSDRLRVGVGFALLKNSYQLDRSDGTTAIDSAGSYFANVAVEAEYWFLPYAGLRGNVSRGFLSLDIPASGVTPASSVDAALWQFSGDGLYRYIWRVMGHDVELRGFAGYHYLKFDIDSQPILTDNTYSGLVVGGGARIPLATGKTNEVGLRFEGSVWPWLTLKESPVETGDSSKPFAYGFGGGLYWFFFERFMVDVGYTYLKFDTDFSGTPTRAVTSDSKTSDLFQGIVVTAGWQP